MKKRFLTILSMAIMFALAFSACDKETTDTFTETEPNGTFATASSLTSGDLCDAEISPSQDIDYFKVTATGALTITLDGDSSLELYITVYDQDQVVVYEDDTGSRGASLTQTINADEYDGTLYLKIESAYVDDTGTYTLKYE